MNAVNAINSAIVIFGVPTSIGALIYIGRKLQILDDLQKTSEKIKSNVKVIGDALIQSSLTQFDGGKLQAYSPVQITEAGDRYLKDTGFIQIFSENEDEFIKCVLDENPKTDYDIEIASVRSVFLMFDKPYFNRIKNYLYNHPKESKTEFSKVAGIYIRNRYLELLNQKGKI